jgi:hypothetical protein
MNDPLDIFALNSCSTWLLRMIKNMCRKMHLQRVLYETIHHVEVETGIFGPSQLKRPI